MTECQAELLKLLKEIDQICSEHNIEYSLAGGTLIGAVRHGGFLPWDDDADVHMTRESAEKLISVLDEQKDCGRTVVRKEDYPSYPNPIWRYTSTENTALQRSNFIEDIPKGLYIDIIIFQPVSDDEDKQKEILEKWYAFSELSTETYTLYSRRSPYVYNTYNKAVEANNQKAICEQLYEEITSVKEGESNSYLVLSQNMCNIFTKDEVGYMKRIPFEDTELPVFERAECVLCKAYGASWFEIPRSQERESHIIVYDYHNPYTYYENDYRSWFDVKQAHENNHRRKDVWFRAIPYYNEVNPKTHVFRDTTVVLEIQQFIESRCIDLKKLVNVGNTDYLLTLFKKYYDTQLADEHRYWGTYLDMPDLLLWAAWWPQTERGNYGRARKYIKMRKEHRGDELSAELNELLCICEGIEDYLKALYTDRDTEEAKKLYSKWIKHMPHQIHFLRGEILFRLEDGLFDEKTKEMVDAALVLYPEDGELLKYLGDIYMKQGLQDKAVKTYKLAEHKLVNGIILRELREKLAE